MKAIERRDKMTRMASSERPPIHLKNIFNLSVIETKDIK